MQTQCRLSIDDDSRMIVTKSAAIVASNTHEIERQKEQRKISEVLTTLVTCELYLLEDAEGLFVGIAN